MQRPYKQHGVTAAALWSIVVFTSTLTGCSHVFYQPAGHKFFEPKTEGYTYNEIELQSTDGTRLMAWHFPAQETASPPPPKGTVVHFHGNGENISSFYRASAWLSREGYEVLAFDYRGYGASEGEPSQEGLNADGLTALRWALDRCTRGKSKAVYAIGQSLGGAVLLRALSDLKNEALPCLKGVVIDSSFINYKSIAREKLASFFLTWPLQWLAYILVSNAYSPEDHLAIRAPVPLLVIHGDQDDVVPFHHGRKLFEKAAAPKEFWQVPGGRHIDAFFRKDPQYRNQLLGWLQSL